MRLRAALVIQIVGLAACAEGFSAPTGGEGPGSGGAPTSDGGSGGGGGVGAAPEGGMPPQGGEGGSPPACEGDPCKLVSPQCGCDDGEKCTINGTAIACGADGSAAVGAACGAIDCAAGGLCLGDAGGGYCAQFCDEDIECGGALVCGVGLNDGAGGTIPDVALCSSNCDPSTVSGCPAGLGCVLGREADGLERFFFMCFPAGAGVAGAACTSAASCAPGYGCYNNGTADVCFKNCNVNTPNCGIQTCFALNDENALPVTVNGYALGVCN